jgi:hypothetical protein
MQQTNSRPKGGRNQNPSQKLKGDKPPAPIKASVQASPTTSIPGRVEKLETVVAKIDRKFVQSVEKDVSISVAEADRLAEIAAVVTDCAGTGQLRSVVHPNFAGDYATSNSDHTYFIPNWGYAVKEQAATAELGMIVVGMNRGESRVAYTSDITPSLNTAEIDQVLSIPPGANISVNSTEAFSIDVPSSSTTVYLTGLLKSNNAPESAVIPSPGSQAPNWSYLMNASPDMSGLDSTGALMNLRLKVTANTCICVYRPWVRRATSGWLSGNWQLVEGDTVALDSTSPTPWIGSTTSPLDYANAFAIELCSTDGTDAYVTCELFPGYSGAEPVITPNIIDLVAAESTLIVAPVSWWSTVSSVMGQQLMLGAQEIITCTASDFNNQGTVVAGKLSKGANISYSEPASDFFSTLSQMPRNNMTGALKFGASGFHIPDFTDRGAGAYDLTRDDVRYYVFRTTPVGTSPPPTMELKVYSNVSYGVTSQIIPTFPVEPVPHVYALFAILGAINCMATNEFHLGSLFNQAKKVKDFVTSPTGRKVIGTGLNVGKEASKYIGPAMGALASLF